MMLMLHTFVHHRLSNLVELLLFDNMLETIPESLFDTKSLQLLNLDRNHLVDIPANVSKCTPYNYNYLCASVCTV